MKIIILVCITIMFTSCQNDELKDIDITVAQIQTLTNTFVYTEGKENLKTGELDFTHIEYTLDQKGLVVRVRSILELGVDTVYDTDYFYKDESVLFMKIKKFVMNSGDTIKIEDDTYYFEMGKLINSKCLDGISAESEDLILASEFNYMMVKQLQEE